jgi:hypothetical protein
MRSVPLIKLSKTVCKRCVIKDAESNNQSSDNYWGNYDEILWKKIHLVRCPYSGISGYHVRKDGIIVLQLLRLSFVLLTCFLRLKVAPFILSNFLPTEQTPLLSVIRIPVMPVRGRGSQTILWQVRSTVFGIWDLYIATLICPIRSTIPALTVNMLITPVNALLRLAGCLNTRGSIGGNSFVRGGRG